MPPTGIASARILSARMRRVRAETRRRGRDSPTPSSRRGAFNSAVSLDRRAGRGGVAASSLPRRRSPLSRGSAISLIPHHPTLAPFRKGAGLFVLVAVAHAVERLDLRELAV